VPQLRLFTAAGVLLLSLLCGDTLQQRFAPKHAVHF
jgi:hypothetical protein